MNKTIKLPAAPGTTDREKAANYVTKMLGPGDHFTSKDLALIIDRKKSETLRVLHWLMERGFVEKRGTGPATSYMVVYREEHKEADFQEAVKPLDPIDEEIKEIDRIVNPGFFQLSSEQIRANEQKRSVKLTSLQCLIDDEYELVKERISFLTHAYEKEPLFRNEYLLQFLYGKLELLERLMEN